MTVMNLVSILVFACLVAASIALIRHLLRRVQDADGLMGINRCGEQNMGSEGSVVFMAQAAGDKESKVDSADR